VAFLAGDSELAQSVHALARAHQDAICDRMKIIDELRSVPREYHPAFRGVRSPSWPAPKPAPCCTWRHRQPRASWPRKAGLAAALRRAGRTPNASASGIWACAGKQQLWRGIS
jgi:hypothetical protein